LILSDFLSFERFRSNGKRSNALLGGVSGLLVTSKKGPLVVLGCCKT